MKLIIDIPEEVKQTFDNAKNEDLYGNYYDHNSLIGKAIQNGIPLPKGHDRLVESIKEETEVSKDQWTPVSQPPKEDGQYLASMRVLDHNFIMIIGYAINLREVDEYDFQEEKAGWFDYDSETGYYEVTDVKAWMPLPPSYQGE